MTDKDRKPANRHRPLRPDEIDLWHRVTRNVVTRRSPAKPAALKEPVVKARPDASKPSPMQEAARSRITGNPKPVKIQPPPPPPLLEMDRRQRQRIARAPIMHDDMIDLHGMRQQRAFEVLGRFLRDAQARNARIVLIITGKGRSNASPSSDWRPEAAGVLRRVVPLWLQSAAIRGQILGFEEAAIAHGGAGALYVRLRKGRGGADPSKAGA